jgi:hypothetical protein
MVYALVPKDLPNYLAKAWRVAPILFAVAPQFVVDQLMLEYPLQYPLRVAAKAAADFHRPRAVKAADQGD